MQKFGRRLLLLPIVSVLFALAGCSDGTTTRTVVVEAASKTAILNPLLLQQFASDLPIIPVAMPDTASYPGKDYYVVSAEQTERYDFGLRNKDGSEIVDNATGRGIRTTVWGYTINDIKAGYLGATIETKSTLDPTGKPVRVKYINNLKDSSGTLLTKHLLTVDQTLDGAMGEPEIRTVAHLHGGHTAPESDGNPMAWVTNNSAAATGMPANPETGFPGRPDGNTVTYNYDNDQLATQLWIHDHAMAITRLNVYAGLAFNYLLRDDYEMGFSLPRGMYEIPLVIQDKSFNEDGSLHYDSNPLLNSSGNVKTDSAGNPVYTSKPEFFGNVITVNGKAWPKLDVEPRRYRFRMLNGSDSRFYNMWLDAVNAGGTSIPTPANAIIQIGNEGGLLPASVADIGSAKSTGLLLATGERADVIVDFSKFPAGAVITLRNDAAIPFPNGAAVAATTTGRIMQFRISKTLAGADSSVVPVYPRSPLPLAAPANTRYLDLQELTDADDIVYDPLTGISYNRLELLLNGLTFSAPITEKPTLNTVEDWYIINNTPDTHPMHLHLVAFEVIEKGSVDPGAYTPADGKGGMPVVAPGGFRPDKNPDNSAAAPNSLYTVQPHERGWKDTVRVPPADEVSGSQGYVRVRARFDRLGAYMWHCHILAHEDHDMMRPFMVVP